MTSCSIPLDIGIAPRHDPADASPFWKRFFPLEPQQVALASETDPFDFVIIGTGMGGGVLAADFISKNLSLSRNTADLNSQSTAQDADDLFRTLLQLASSAKPDADALIAAVRERGADVCEGIVRSSLPQALTDTAVPVVREKAAELFEKVARSLGSGADVPDIGQQAADLVADLADVLYEPSSGYAHAAILQRSSALFEKIAHTTTVTAASPAMLDTLVEEGASLFKSCVQERARPKRILILDKGGVTFPSHVLNGPRPPHLPSDGASDAFYQLVRSEWMIDTAPSTRRGENDGDNRASPNPSKPWNGGAVYALGGRSTVWGLFTPRIDSETLHKHFPSAVHEDLHRLGGSYYQRVEQITRLSYPVTLPLHQIVIDKLNRIDHEPVKDGWPLPATQWQWGRVASRFRNDRNFAFAEGAFSTVDSLLETAMINGVVQKPEGVLPGGAHILINAPVLYLEPRPDGKTDPKSRPPVTHVVVRGHLDRKNRIRCRHAIICAGSVESPAILLRSVDGDPGKYGGDFNAHFGHLTDHHIFSVGKSFIYRKMANRETLNAMKLQTEITFRNTDGEAQETALVHVSLDAESFLPRSDRSATGFPQLVIVFMLPARLARGNSVNIDKNGDPHIHVDFADVPDLLEKKDVCRRFAIEVMKTLARTLDLQYLDEIPMNDGAPIFDIIDLDKLEDSIKELNPIPLGTVAHELGTIPMPDNTGSGGIVDDQLEMQYGWKNVSVCDLSVFPHSPAANPALSLAALALRLSDRLLAPEDVFRAGRPIRVYNMTTKNLWARVTLSNPSFPVVDPSDTLIIPGNFLDWRRNTRESLFVHSESPQDDDQSIWGGGANSGRSKFTVQPVWPGLVTLVVTRPSAQKTSGSLGGEGETSGHVFGLPVRPDRRVHDPLEWVPGAQRGEAESLHYEVVYGPED
ncbi:hypothetical protein PUNSTDRAFT_131420 [Punctularia strigosozonata HHB-11173 SS5]|uniref:uncharacterized protein n=1 Tax=Punctularia strigosozonata (strain HHB-11173) TaxID=741275 RepID=UPI0004417B01|nr:uncharacterized protein PUNSTDRAFT_131420 [Punctularia strigosozonata HHB-11173 SS5]EIN11249.1 hypothetical protein PUNSTDRAFT_131420 [Punctularia strigosozonata HHB-11173 SS5]